MTETETHSARPAGFTGGPCRLSPGFRVIFRAATADAQPTWARQWRRNANPAWSWMTSCPSPRFFAVSTG